MAGRGRSDRIKSFTLHSFNIKICFTAYCETSIRRKYSTCIQGNRTLVLYSKTNHERKVLECAVPVQRVNQKVFYDLFTGNGSKLTDTVQQTVGYEPRCPDFRTSGFLSEPDPRMLPYASLPSSTSISIGGGTPSSNTTPPPVRIRCLANAMEFGRHNRIRNM